VRDVASEATANGRYSLREEEIDALAQYEDHFPRSVASQAETPLGRTLQRYRLASDSGWFVRTAELKVARAGSFSLLRGFSRVGGVLIGESPENPNDRADVRDIQWRFEGRNVVLVLTDGSGQRREFGPFDRSLVHQALAYAADGRPVAVTMTKARPLPQLKIHLHPSLVDTPLGCRVEQLDRLVDTYAGMQLPERQQITATYQQQLAVYNVAWSRRRAALATAMRPDEAAKVKEGADRVARSWRSLAAKGLKQPGLFDDPSVLRRKPEFFDPEVVKAARSCRGAGAARFEECVEEKFTSSSALKERDKKALRRWFDPPAGFEPWSGVRERKFRITSDLSFLRAPAANTDEGRLWPFDFIVQIAFTSAPVSLPDKQQDQYVDRQPVEFEKIRPAITKLVAEGIDRSGFRPMFEDLRNFTVLQRMFRAALNGSLGERFPMEKLSRLEAETAGGIPYFHTARWNGSVVGQFEFRLRLAAQASRTEPWMSSAAARAQLCLSALSRGGLGGPACDFDVFRGAAERACPAGYGRTTPGCLWAYVVEASEAMPRYVRMESAFGVIEDQQEGGAGRACPALIPGAPPPLVAAAR
jgi:hypothetical protein